MSEPTTAAGRALADDWPTNRPDLGYRAVLAIEREARADERKRIAAAVERGPVSEPERLAALLNSEIVPPPVDDDEDAWLRWYDAMAARLIAARVRVPAEPEAPDEYANGYADGQAEAYERGRADALASQPVPAPAPPAQPPSGDALDPILAGLQRNDMGRVLALALSSQGYAQTDSEAVGLALLREIEECGYTLRLTTNEERRARNDRGMSS